MKKQLYINPFHTEVVDCSGYLDLRVRSSRPIDILFVPSRAEARLMMEGDNFRHYSFMSTQMTREYSAAGHLSPGTCCVFANRSNSPANVELWIEG
ncbi:MAG: hypothetical protein R6U44_10565 [Archaeoglobaceae archaeon]